MTGFYREQLKRVLTICGGMSVLAAGLGACAELELGADAVKRINDSLPVQTPSQAAVQQVAARPTTSPYLAPAPEIFDATGLAMWDGQRTLQGIWVAHPAAETARRVRIVNPETGLAVDGALFRRDDSLSGPPVLISSEAAAALGMRPGYPVELSIVALRPLTPAERQVNETPAEQPAAQPEIAEATTPPASETPATDAPADTPEVAAATPAPADETPAAEPPASPAETADADAPTEPEVAEPAAETLAAAPIAEPAPAPAAGQPEPPVAAEALAADAQPESGANDDVTGPLDIAESTPTPPAKPAPPAPSPAAEPGGSDLDRPYLQAGTFGVAENATRLVARLEKQGIPAVARPLQSGGTTLTRVLAGPFATAAERNAARDALAKIGLRDAVPVRR